MNIEQKLYIRVSHNGLVDQMAEVQGLLPALKLIHESYTSHGTNSQRKVAMSIELSSVPFTLGSSLLTREQQIEQQMMNQALTNEDEIIYEPDVTLRECNEAWASPEGQLMFKYQRADMRVGVSSETLNAMREAYESKFPRVAPHGPLWTM